MMDAFELPTTLVQALRRRAVQEPERLALRFLAEDDGEGVVLSYRDLDLRARSIAAALQAHAQLGDRAVLLFPSGPDYVAAFFGCLYAGVIAVPAYPPESARRHHQERLLSIIADAEPRLVLTTADLREPLLQMNAQLSAANAPQLLCVDQLDPAVAEAWDEPQVRPEHIAFLQYTSGSTALPKGVQVSHGNLVANEVLIRRGFGIGADDVIVSWLPLYHDMGLIGGLLQPIFSGVPCVLMSPRYFLERPVRWLEAISQYGGTVSGGPDFAYRLCSERVAESALQRLDLSGWRVAFSGSEPIRQDSLERFAEKFAASRFDASSFFACYGLAEATLFVTGGQRGQGIPALAVDGEALARNRIAEGEGSVLMCCGRSQPEHAVLIVDAASGEVLGDDNVGEIWAAGPSIAHGYWRNPEASAKTFVERDGRTWLRTGDLGFLRDGELFVTGRLKDMLIVRGHNLYPQDIERTVESEVPSARKGRVAAFAVTVDGEEGIGIAAEIGRGVQKSVPAQEPIDSIRQAVAEAYQEAPKVVALLNPGALPKTSSGKLQRSACRLRLEDGSLDSYALFPGLQAVQEAQPPAGDDELLARIGEIWKARLGVAQVAPRDHFFLLGGNSIGAAQVVAQVRDSLGVALDLRQLFEAPTLQAFSATVARQLAAGLPAEAPMAHLPRGVDLPQSAAQQRLWLTWQIDPQSAAYNIPGGLRLRGELDEAALRASFQRLVERHEALRTRFLERDGAALQRIDERGEFAWQFVDLAALAEHERAAAAAQRREAEAQQPFDLEKGPLLRVSLVRLDEQEHQLWVTLHHIVADGWSLNLLLDEFSRLYAEACGGQPADLAPLELHYAEFAAWQRQWLDAGEGARQLAYWRERLGDAAPVLELATDHPRTARQASPAARYSLRVDEALARAIREAALDHEASVFMWLLAAFQALLHRHSGQGEIRIGVPSANRQRLETQGLVGFFINTLVLRGTPRARQPFAALLGEAREATLGAQANQDLPFDQVLAACGQGGQLFQVLFNHQQRDLSALRRLPGLLADELALAQPRSQVRPATAERGGRSRSPDPEFRLRRGPLRRGQHPAFRRAIPGAAAPGRGRPAALPRRYRPGRRRAGGAPRRMGQRALRAGARLAAGAAGAATGAVRRTRRPGVGRRQPRLRRTARPGQPPGPLPARQGRRPGRAGSDLRRAFAATAGRSAGDRQGGRRLRAAGPGLPQRTPGLHARRQRRRAAADPGPSVRAPAWRGGRHADLPGQPQARQLAEPGTGPAPARRQSRLRHLHLRLHRPAEGRGQHPRGAGRAPAVDAGHLRPRRRRRADAEGAGELRRVGVGVLLAAGHRLPAGPRRPRRAPRSGAPGGTGAAVRGDHAALRAAAAATVHRRTRRRRLRQPAPPVLRRRGASGGAAQPRVATPAGGGPA